MLLAIPALWLHDAFWVAAFLPVGWPVLKSAWVRIRKGEVFTEFLLMSIASLGAFAIGEAAEGVAVMLFYTVGETLQDLAVARSRRHIRALLDLRPPLVRVLRGGTAYDVAPAEVAVGETVEVAAGGRVALDGRLVRGSAQFDLAALTGESVPVTLVEGDEVPAGAVNLDGWVRIEALRPESESAVARILELVQHAVTKKAKTELFIRRFAKKYTPAVTALAAALVVVPYFVVDAYVFEEWLYRALVFLVVSCPCALVISIPLGYFGGIGAASRSGILVKGAHYLDVLAAARTVVFDKTGTLTHGRFAIVKTEAAADAPAGWETWAARLEAGSTHPVARAIVAAHGGGAAGAVHGFREEAGAGVMGVVDGHEVRVGTRAGFAAWNTAVPGTADAGDATLAHVAVDGRWAGCFHLADTPKADAAEAVRALRALGIADIRLLSGDRPGAVAALAAQVGIAAEAATAGLRPEGKTAELERLRAAAGAPVVFVGDGLNDAPALAVADVGVAMGGLGTDAAVESADIVLRTDQPARLATAIRIARATKRVVWQNIGLAFGVKLVVLAFGAAGHASMWEAVFADVGVALLAIVNASRVLRLR